MSSEGVRSWWEGGRVNRECMGGIGGCVEDFGDVGRGGRPDVATRRAAMEAAYEVIHQHERGLMERMIAGLVKIPGLRIYGITDGARFDERCATLAVKIEGRTPLELASKVGELGLFALDGQYLPLKCAGHISVEQP